MKRANKILAACTLSIGVGAGAMLFSPTGKDAASNVVLASVDWVNSIVTPINTKVTTLETKVSTLQSQVTSLQQQINNLKTGSGSMTTNPAVIPSTVYVSKSSAYIRSGATTNYKILATKTKGTALKVIDSFTSAAGLWYRTPVSSTVNGWIYSGDVSTTKVVYTPTSVVTTGVVNIRRGASTSYALVETIQKAGITLKYVTSFTNSNGEVWYNVITPSGKKGWMTANLGEVK
jgi:uncharacterized protein YgiM (DUF1202 family)